MGTYHEEKFFRKIEEFAKMAEDVLLTGASLLDCEEILMLNCQLPGNLPVVFMPVNQVYQNLHSRNQA